MKGAVRFGLLVFVGVLVAQAAWILAVPPFRGADEFDHAYRASGVASGQWWLRDPAAHGRGLEVEVPVTLAAAAAAQCRVLPHTGVDNCRPFDVKGDRGIVATGAGTYPPAYYWVVGQAGRRSEGAGSLYAMRLATALLSAVGLAVAATLLAFTGGIWTRLGFLTSMTPVLVYSTIVAAPNGPEMVAGACLWAGLLAFGAPTHSSRGEMLSLGVIALSSVLLSNLRLLGPLWVLLIAAVAITFIGPAQFWRQCREHRTASAGVVVVSLLGALAAATWTLTSGGLGPPNVGNIESERFPASAAFVRLPLWLLQIIGAFPYPNQPGPTAIYPLVLIVCVALLVLGVRRASARQFGALAGALIIVAVGPVLLTLLTMNSQGVIWQGRYALPFIVGILPMAGLLIDRSSEAIAGHRFIPLALVMLGVAQVMSVAHVLGDELGRTVSASDGSWVRTSVWSVSVVMTASCLILSAGVLTARRSRAA